MSSRRSASQTCRLAALRSCREAPRQVSKRFFFEKKNQKTFTSLAYVAGEDRDSDVKVFCFFSSEKKTFPFRKLNLLFAALSKVSKKFFG